MNSKQIWNQANEQRELIRSIYHALCEGRDIDAGMNQLKQRIPCLYGVDADRHALVFQSGDEGMIALLVEEQGDTFALALTGNIELDGQEGTGMEMKGL